MWFVIRSFRCRETERIFQRRFVRKFPSDIQQRAFMKLNAIDAAVRLEDLRLPPSNRLEASKGNRKGQHSDGSMTDGGFVSYGEAVTPKTWKSSIIIEE